jgi:uncharacterized damage-inducible protein DinB
MQPFAEEFLSALQTLHAEMERAIDGLPQAALDWVPGPDMNSLAVLVVHVAGAERFWIGDVVARDPSDRDRPAEFRTGGLDADVLKARLAGSLTYTRGAVEPLTLQDLEAARNSPRDNRQFTVAGCLAHVLAHTATHVSHVQLTRQLWDQQQQG